MKIVSMREVFFLLLFFVIFTSDLHGSINYKVNSVLFEKKLVTRMKGPQIDNLMVKFFRMKTKLEETIYTRSWILHQVRTRCIQKSFSSDVWNEMIGPLSPTSVILTDRKRTAHSWAALHFHSIANFDASLKWLQMISYDFQWLHLTY